MRALLIVLAGLWAADDTERPGAEQIVAQVKALELEPLAPGSRGELSLVVLEPPDRGLPLEVRIDAGPLELDDNRLDWSFIVDPLALTPRVRTNFRAPREPGSYELRAAVTYFVCDEQWCRQKHGQVHWTVTVK